MSTGVFSSAFLCVYVPSPHAPFFCNHCELRHETLFCLSRARFSVFDVLTRPLCHIESSIHEKFLRAISFCEISFHIYTMLKILFLPQLKKSPLLCIQFIKIPFLDKFPLFNDDNAIHFPYRCETMRYHDRCYILKEFVK